MSLFPGGRKRIDDGSYEYSLDDDAITQSMAEAMEGEMVVLFKKIKGQELPATGRLDRRLLFVAVARGVLKYLRERQSDDILVETVSGVSDHTHKVWLKINLDCYET